METLFVPLALVAGALLAVQAGANAQLSKAVGSPFAATTLQLAIGTSLLVLVALFTGTLAVLAKFRRLSGGISSEVLPRSSTSSRRSFSSPASAQSFPSGSLSPGRC